MNNRYRLVAALLVAGLTTGGMAFGQSVTTITTIGGSVYGGGAFADTGGGTTVNLTGGTIERDVYGGGLGQLADEEKGLSDVAAIVGGNTNVYLNEAVADTCRGCVVKGNIFGCNNVNGTPKGYATVRIYKTQNDSASQIVNPTEGEQTAKVKGRYDVTAVYGGGNQAAYDPDSVNGKTQVIIDGCDRTSIKYVYGGGNAASVPEANVMVNGTYEIEYVFGGGNGSGFMDKEETIPNPGADVGIINSTTYEADKAVGKVLADRGGKYGTGNANTNIYGGTVHNIYGGSNTKGNIVGKAVLTIDELDDCELDGFKEVFGMGNQASMDGEAELRMGCIKNVRLAKFYGGAKNADVEGNVVLTIRGGKYGQVFGGNQSGGTISGTITVNIDESGCTPIDIDELYGGGDQAAYPGTDATTGKGKVTVNIMAATRIGTIYGGGLGSAAAVNGDTYVNINMKKGYTTSDWKNDDSDTEGENRSQNDLGTIGTVFGGGNKAKLNGSTHVQIGTGTAADGKTALSRSAAYISGNVYGGGNNADVTGNTNVVIGSQQE